MASTSLLARSRLLVMLYWFKVSKRSKRGGSEAWPVARAWLPVAALLHRFLFWVFLFMFGWQAMR